MRHDYGLNRGDRYGAMGSSHVSYVPGIEWQEGDERLIEPATGWGGNRGAKLRRDSFGRLYAHSGDRMDPVDPADPSGVIARSAERSGYRGARPFFGADNQVRWKAGTLEYQGPQVGGVILGLAGLAVLFELVRSSSRG